MNVDVIYLLADCWQFQQKDHLSQLHPSDTLLLYMLRAVSNTLAEYWQYL